MAGRGRPFVVAWDEADTEEALREAYRVERVFEELRAHIEGIVYPTIEAKVAAVEAILAELDTDPERIKQLTRWHWIEASLHDLPQNHAA